jgi:hypothetical protein
MLISVYQSLPMRHAQRENQFKWGLLSGFEKK